MRVSDRISKRERELPGVRIEELLKKGHEKGYLSLGAGEPDFPAPPAAVAYGKEVLAKSSRYTVAQGLAEFREAAAKKLWKDNGISCGPENIIAANGSTEGIFLALAATVDPGEHVIVPDPGFLSFSPSVEFLGGHSVSMELREEEKWLPNTDRPASAVDKKRTKAIVINSPSNPTGTVFSKKTLEQIADFAIENDLLVISDEAYEKFVYDDVKHVSIGSLNGLDDRVITLQSFSKAFAMPGWRLGYACAPVAIAEAMAKVRIFTTLATSTLSQSVGAFALEKMDRKYVEQMRKEYDKRRKIIVPRLNDMGLPTVEPKGAFYAFSNVKEFTSSSDHFVDVMLKKSKVIVMPGTEFGKHGEGYVRCSYATALEQIEEALDKMEQALKHRWV